MNTEDSYSKRPRFMNPAYMLLYGILVTAAPVVVQFIIMASQASGRFFWGIGSGILIWGCVALGFALGLMCLGIWRFQRSPSRSGGAYSRALVAGTIVGLLGAYPVGVLTLSTTLASDLGVGKPLGIPLTGLYLALLFGGYMLCWERCEARRGAPERL